MSALFHLIIVDGLAVEWFRQWDWVVWEARDDLLLFGWYECSQIFPSDELVVYCFQ